MQDLGTSRTQTKGMNRTYLFTYGTLRRGFDLEIKTELKNALAFITTGNLKAVLYDLGDYPGAVKANSGNEVEGDVFEIVDAEKVFQQSDEYEGEEYNRELATVKTDDGDKLQAWVYWYKGDVEDKTKIDNGDYLNYLKTKDSLR